MSDELREAVARIIDQNAWERHDNLIRQADAGEYDDGVPVLEHEAQHIREDAPGLVKAALAKADAILALSPPQGGGKATKMLVDTEWLRRKVESDPDCDVEVVPPPSPDALARAVEALEGAIVTLAASRHLIGKYVPEHRWLPEHDSRIDALKVALSALASRPGSPT